MKTASDWGKLNAEIVACEKCPRLVRYRREVAERKRRAYLGQTYWGSRSPTSVTPGRGSSSLASRPPPTAGTGRAGCSPATGAGTSCTGPSGRRDSAADLPRPDGPGAGRLRASAVIGAASALPKTSRPPKSFPTVLVARGNARFRSRGRVSRPGADRVEGRRRPRFGEGVAWRTFPGFFARRGARLEGGRLLIASYHPSQRNTFTGKVTEGMMDEVLFACVDFFGG